MSRVDKCAAIALALSLAILQSACFLAGKPRTVAAAAPAPQPLPAAKPVSPPEPLSVFQTQVQLPPEQPINPEAIPPAPKLEEPALTQGPPHVTRHTSPSQTKPETSPPTPPTPATPPPNETAPPAGEVAPVQEVLSPEARRRFQESADSRKPEIQQLLSQVKSHPLNAEQNREVRRIQSLVEQCDAAEKRGEMREADKLSELALALARELAGGK
jgi:hypothetical protein